MVTCAASSFPVNPELSKRCDDSTEEPFNKPWIGNCFMFIGELMLFIAVVRENRCVPRSESIHSLPPVPWYYFGIPSLLDVLGSGLSGVSMLFISASVWQLLRGSIILYTALLSVMFLGRRLEAQHVTGLLITLIGLTLVGISAYFEAPDNILGIFISETPSAAIVGIGLTVASQFCSAIQMVVEESLLKSTSAAMYAPPSPSRVVANEGLCGLIVMMIVLFIMQFTPGDDHGSFENSVDSIGKISHSPLLFGLVVIYCVSIALFNQSGMSVSKYLSSLHRTLIDSLRAVVVWFTELAVFYITGSTRYGTAWTRNSFIQLLGFVLVVFGTMVYNEVIMIFKRGGREDEQAILQVRNE
jgi:drug/metabolite transporter (DMT)-like permease